jgi:hypothetical protein
MIKNLKKWKHKTNQKKELKLSIGFSHCGCPWE